MNKATINGIQQVGIGVKDANEAWKWYRKIFKMDVPIFQDSAEAALMTRYTAGKVEKRHAILAMNMQGGGGFEIWQFTSRTPTGPTQNVTWGDLGILAVKIRCKDIQSTYSFMESEGVELLGKPSKNPIDVWHFYLKDPYGNIFEIEENKSWFSQNNDLTGGVSGVVIGVSDTQKSIPLYQSNFQHSELLYDGSDVWEDFSPLLAENEAMSRVILQSSNKRTGAFGRLLCQTTVELIAVKDSKREKIYDGRLWGDLGFIHVCFDVSGMKNLQSCLQDSGFPFTVDSNNGFDMGKAAGHFAYIEDPDGTLVEMVETHKIPIMEKWGWYLNLKNRKQEKTLPNFIVKMLSLNRVKS
ncbi:VOC family protein [Algoriphagus machipongonensis]|uniref:Glyoxalase family protein n=1 Tax=Algoriphagus machipongonensis TaxID=388413 RepID=A3HSR8_9BACT|nr:VOC family protein [Algoriphagus machipongonensis]EAZ82886.1 glyoxalase family protein [Algoriphagus machipongonensis]